MSQKTHRRISYRFGDKKAKVD